LQQQAAYLNSNSIIHHNYHGKGINIQEFKNFFKKLKKK